MGVDSNIVLAILKAIEASDLDPVAYPNVSFTGSVPYYRVNILPIPTEPLDYVNADDYSGIVQIDVVTGIGIGMMDAHTLVATVLSIFPRNTILTEDGTQVRFDRKGWVSPPIQENSEYRIPVNFLYRTLY